MTARAEIERLEQRHSIASRRRSAPPIICPTVALESCTIAQRTTSLSAASGDAVRAEESQHHEAEAEVVGLGQRVQAGERIGKAQEPDRPGEEEEHADADHEHAEEIEREAHRSPVPCPCPCPSPEPGEAPDEGDGGEARQQREPERHVLDARNLGRRGRQQQRRDAARSEKLHRHHPVHAAWATQHPREARGDSEKDQRRGDDERVSHDRASSETRPPRPRVRLRPAVGRRARGHKLAARLRDRSR